jgi:hypothetical protein
MPLDNTDVASIERTLRPSADKQNFRYRITQNAGLFDMEFHLRDRGLATAMNGWITPKRFSVSSRTASDSETNPVELLPLAKYAKRNGKKANTITRQPRTIAFLGYG